MANIVEDQGPFNLAGQQFIPVASIDVLEFCEGDKHDAGPPTEVHLWLKIEGSEDTPFAIRFHSPNAVDQLIVALITHRRAVWGGPADADDLQLEALEGGHGNRIDVRQKD